MQQRYSHMTYQAGIPRGDCHRRSPVRHRFPRRPGVFHRAPKLGIHGDDDQSAPVEVTGRESARFLTHSALSGVRRRQPLFGSLGDRCARTWVSEVSGLHKRKGAKPIGDQAASCSAAAPKCGCREKISAAQFTNTRTLADRCRFCGYIAEIGSSSVCHSVMISTSRPLLI